jgi:hypothetical protein
MATDALSAALDRLYAAPLDDFVALRKRLTAELRAAGEVAAAREIAGAPKPSRTAWALNQTARRHPALLRALFEARDAAAGAAAAGDAAAVRQTSRGFRERVGVVVRAARDVLAEAGAELTAAQARRVGETLQAASASPGQARERLVAGRLIQDVDVEDPFAGIEAGEMPVVAPERAGERQREREQEEEQEKEREEEQDRERERQRDREREEKARAVATARARVVELEEAARDARAEARVAETAAARAQREAQHAKAAADEADARLERARDELTRLTSSVS